MSLIFSYIHNLSLYVEGFVCCKLVALNLTEGTAFGLHKLTNHSKI